MRAHQRYAAAGLSQLHERFRPGHSLAARNWLEVAILLLGLTLGSATSAVGPGFSLLRIQPGTPQFVAFEGIGAFQVEGVPIGPGSADTIIQTFGDADPYGGFNAEVVGHALRSIQPVSISDHEYDVFVNLDPSRPSTGYLYVRSIGFTDASFHCS
jgi:hypothetical protein